MTRLSALIHPASLIRTLAGPLLLASLSSPAMAALDSTEQADLLLMREEEKMAQDLYNQFYELWGASIFASIAESESRHTSSVLKLINTYGLSDPAAGKAAGDFTSTEIQSLYDSLLARGSVSEVAAVEAAIDVEVTDIADLENTIARTDESLIIRVYNNLLKGSRNHLSAFTARLDALGGSSQNGNALDPGTAIYEPISQVLYLPAIDVTDSQGQVKVYDAMLRMIETLPQTLELVTTNLSTRLPAPSVHASYNITSGTVSIPSLRVGALEVSSLEQSLYEAELQHVPGSINPRLFSINFIRVAE